MERGRVQDPDLNIRDGVGGGAAPKNRNRLENQLPLFPAPQSGKGLLPTYLGILPLALFVDFVVIRQVMTNTPLPSGLGRFEDSCLETQPLTWEPRLGKRTVLGPLIQ